MASGSSRRPHDNENGYIIEVPPPPQRAAWALIPVRRTPSGRYDRYYAEPSRSDIRGSVLYEDAPEEEVDDQAPPTHQKHEKPVAPTNASRSKTTRSSWRGSERNASQRWSAPTEPSGWNFERVDSTEQPVSAQENTYPQLNRPERRNLQRMDSTGSRMSRRLSRASYRLSQAAEYSGLNFAEANSIELSDPHQSQVSNSTAKDLENPKSKEVNPVDKAADELPGEGAAQKHGLKFYLIIVALNIAQVLVALEGTVTSTALPSIVAQLGGGSSYVWASSGYFLASTVLQPFYGQMANILGRRILIIFAVCMFMLGSGISGGAPSMGVLILGRVIQGMGGGGISMLSNLIVCDLVPLRDRGKFMALVLIAMAVGSGMGPFVGGIVVQRATWRWVFYLNLPIGAVALVLLILFLRVKGPSEKATWAEKLAKVDLAGNAIFITGVSFILVALAYAGTLWPWRSYNTIMTLLFGFATMAVFVFYEDSSYCLHPTMPLRLFQNRTSAAAYAMTFIHSFLTILVLYFLPVYFQSVLLSSPTRSGVQMLPTVIVLIPFSALSGTLLSKLGRYKPFHLAGFAVVSVGLGCFITLDDKSPVVAWIMVQLVVAIGTGFSFSTLLPAAQAYLDDKDTAAATATWAFLRQFGVVWGVSVPAAIFNSQIEHLLPRISDTTVRATLSGGAAYDHGTKDYIGRFQEPLRGQIVSIYADSLKIVWVFGTAIAGLGLLLVFLEKEISLRKDNEGEYGLQD